MKLVFKYRHLLASNHEDSCHQHQQRASGDQEEGAFSTGFGQHSTLEVFYNAFDDAVLTDGADDDVLADSGRCLMMQTVDGEGFAAHDTRKLGAVAEGDRVVTDASAYPVIMIAAGNVLNILMERTAEIGVH